jgi:hypothetical protein
MFNFLRRYASAFIAIGIVLLASVFATPTALAQSSDAPPSLPQATHLPPLDLGTASLKSGDTYSDCPRSPTGEADCELDQVTFDGPTGVDGLVSQAAHRVNMIAYGPGVSLGNLGGWRNTKLNVDFMTIATRGISQAQTLFLTKHASGDTMGAYQYIYSDGGSTALSDESIKGLAIDLGETTGYFHGSVASTSGTSDTQPSLAFASGNNWTTDGAPLLDITKGTVAGHFTGNATILAGSSYLGSVPVENDLPLSTAWGVCNDPIPNNHQVQTNTPFTCNVRLQYGRFQAGGMVCVSGPNYPEQAPITAASEPSGGSQSISISVRNPNTKGASIFQGGLCGQYVSFDANLAVSGYRSSYYAFGAVDAHHLILGMNLKGQVIGGLPMASEAERFGVDGLNGYHLYPGCEVVANRSLKADPTCEPNMVPWAAGDLVEAPHNVAVNAVGTFIDLVQNTPANGSLSSGDLLQIHGMGAVGGNFIAHRTANRNPYSIFKAYGGQFDPPDMHRIEGLFHVGLSFNIAPETVVQVFGNADHSSRPMNLFAMPGGNIAWNPATATLTAPNIQASNFAGLRGTSGLIGGSKLALGECATGTAAIPGAKLNMVPVTVASTIGAPGFSAQGAFQVSAQVTANDTVTVSVCALIAGAPKASTYIVALQ